MIAPSITINVMLSTISALKQFDHVFVLTRGGPGYSSEVIGTAIYTTAFGNNEFGYGSALSVLFLVVVASIVLLQFKLLQRREMDLS